MPRKDTTMADVTVHDHGRTGKVFIDCADGDVYATVTKPNAISETYTIAGGDPETKAFQWLRDQGVAVDHDEQIKLEADLVAQCRA